MRTLAREFLALIVGIAVFMLGYMLEKHLFGPWRERGRLRRIVRANSARMAREIDESRQYFRSIHNKNGRTGRRSPRNAV